MVVVSGALHPTGYDFELWSYRTVFPVTIKILVAIDHFIALLQHVTSEFYKKRTTLISAEYLRIHTVFLIAFRDALV